MLHQPESETPPSVPGIPSLSSSLNIPLTGNTKKGGIRVPIAFPQPMTDTVRDLPHVTDCIVAFYLLLLHFVCALLLKPFSSMLICSVISYLNNIYPTHCSALQNNHESFLW